MKLIVLGAPGAGKGTQAEFLSDRYGIPVIGTGNMIRSAMQASGSLKDELNVYMKKGHLVPDDVVFKLLLDRLDKPDAARGFVLDGFPRTVRQAEMLDEMGMDIDKVISIEAPDEEIISRLSGRRICKKCGSSYHIDQKRSLVSGICDRCGGELVRRDDDTEEIINERLSVYHSETEPVKIYYIKQGKLQEVQSQKEVVETKRLTLAAVEA